MYTQNMLILEHDCTLYIYIVELSTYIIFSLVIRILSKITKACEDKGRVIGVFLVLLLTRCSTPLSFNAYNRLVLIIINKIVEFLY